MTMVVGIRFKDSGKTYYFDPGDHELQQGDQVVVETVRGMELAKVAYERRDVDESEIVGDLKPVIRRAEPSDFERMYLLHSRHTEVLERCAEKVRDHNLPMNLIKAEYSFDGSRLTFYFTAENRVDFRMLVRDLARTFKTRIELRQIGPRDEAKLIGGVGPCGRLLCCTTFLPDYARVSIKMAKEQDLPLNPSKISGVCGRLLCCLSYEHEQYADMRSQLPRKGAWVHTPDGPGEVVSVNVLQQLLTVQLSSSGMQEIYPLDKIEESTDNVSAIARYRNEEGITPAAQNDWDVENEDIPIREEGRRSQVDLDDSDVLEALALLENGELSFEDFNLDGQNSAPDEASSKRSENRTRFRDAKRQKTAQQVASNNAGKSGRTLSDEQIKAALSMGSHDANAGTPTAPSSESDNQQQHKQRKRKRRAKTDRND